MKSLVYLIATCVNVCALVLISFLYLYTTHQHIVLRLPTGFFPSVVHIDKNDSLRFINVSLHTSWPAAGPHPTHISYSDFDPLTGIPPLHSWIFTFSQEGAFTFHDHLAPDISGIVISGTTDISNTTSQSTCDSMTDKQNQSECIEIYFKNISKTTTYSQARTIFEDVSIRYPDNCHSFAHSLGKTAYRAYIEGTLPDIGQEASSCAYGLWHGFTTAMQEDRGFSESKNFCESLSSATNELTRVNRLNCYHGIGIGLIPDPPDPQLWGNFQALVEPAVAYCDTIKSDPVFTERCLTGVFHAMDSYMGSLYGFALEENTLEYCTMQKPEHQYACFITLSASVPRFTDFDLKRTVEILQKYSPTEEIFTETFRSAAVMLADTMSSNEELGKFLDDCTSTKKELRPLCLFGITNNLVSNSAPGTEHIKINAFCSSDEVDEAEKTECFRQVISHLTGMFEPKKVATICNAIPSEYRDGILECTR